MSQRLGTVQPSRQARALAAFMEGREDVQRQVLIETIESAEMNEIMESGRTICPEGAEEIRGPLGRFPKAVQLQECPVGASGVMHTHTSLPQLRDPEHSLPDMANVLLENVTASMVVGVEARELLLAPADPEAGIERFQDALGLEADSTRDVVDAIREGRIRNPPDARDRVRSRLPGLFQRQPTGFFDLRERVSQLADEQRIPAQQPLLASCAAFGPAPNGHGHERRSVHECCTHIRSRMQANERVVWNAVEDAKVNPIPIVVSSAIGSFGASLLRDFLRG